MTLGDGVERLSACLLELHALPLDHTFLDGVLRVVRWLIPSEHAVYGLTDPGMKMALLWMAHPHPIDGARWLPVFDAHFGDHPLHGAAAGHAPGDVVCTRELGGEVWPRSGLFREFCQPLEMGHQLLCRLPSAPGYMEVVGAARAQGGFLPDERELFVQLADHVVLAWSKVRRIGAADGAVGASGPQRRVQHVQCDGAGRVRLATDGSHRLLARYFDDPGADARLPPEITRWIDHQLALAPAGQTDPAVFERRLVVERDGQILEIWLASAAGRATHDLYLRERAQGRAPAGRSRPEPCASLPQAASRWALTTRQTRVLEGVLRGATNKEIARDLGLAEVTIEYHLTTLFRRLQAPGRAALIARCYTDAPPPAS